MNIYWISHDYMTIFCKDVLDWMSIRFDSLLSIITDKELVQIEVIWRLTFDFNLTVLDTGLTV